MQQETTQNTPTLESLGLEIALYNAEGVLLAKQEIDSYHNEDGSGPSLLQINYWEDEVLVSDVAFEAVLQHGQEVYRRAFILSAQPDAVLGGRQLFWDGPILGEGPQALYKTKELPPYVLRVTHDDGTLLIESPVACRTGSQPSHKKGGFRGPFYAFKLKDAAIGVGVAMNCCIVNGSVVGKTVRVPACKSPTLIQGTLNLGIFDEGTPYICASYSFLVPKPSVLH